MKNSTLFICLCTGFALQAQEKQDVMNIIAIGAHPDDCDDSSLQNSNSSTLLISDFPLRLL